MERSRTLGGISLLLSCVVGCSASPGLLPVGSEEFSYLGTVSKIENYVPVDGGFIIAIDLDSGGTVEEAVAGLGGWQVPPPLTEERKALLDAVYRLQVGDRVRAEGTRGGNYPGIERLTILDPSGRPG